MSQDSSSSKRKASGELSDLPEAKRQKVEEAISDHAEEDDMDRVRENMTWKTRAAKSGLSFADTWDVPSLPCTDGITTSAFNVRVFLLRHDATVKVYTATFSCEEYARRMHVFLSAARKVEWEIPAVFCHNWSDPRFDDWEGELEMEDGDGDYLRGVDHAKFRDYFCYLEEQRKIESGHWSGSAEYISDSFGESFEETKKDLRIIDAEWIVGPLDE